MTIKIVVGYRTRPVANLSELIPKFSAPSTWKDEQKIQAEILSKQTDFMADAKDIPYTGTLDEVVLVDSSNKKLVHFSYAEGRHPGGPKPPVCVGVRNWILKAYPDAWGSDTHESGRSSVIFMGFEPRRFLKILGLECSLPSINKPLPPRMWYSNSDHRDILEAIMPNQECKRLTLDVVLKCRRPVEDDAAKKWDANLKDWKGPGVDPLKDVRLTTELATQLGFIKD